jgi:hypothetical protein
MAIGIFQLVTRDISEIDIPGSFFFSYRPCPFEFRDRGGVEVTQLKVRVEPCYMLGNIRAEDIPYP